MLIIFIDKLHDIFVLIRDLLFVIIRGKSLFLR